MKNTLILVLMLAGFAGQAAAATPPALVNYQGVLRNASDAPLTGTYEMVFHFFSASTGGDEILVDTHTISGPSPVVVSGGLFNVQLGSGTITDGAGPGSYASLADVFRDYGTVYLSVQVAGETLTPRTRIISAPYAENASNLEGKSAASFIDTSSAAQTKSGPLTVNAGTSSAIVGGSGYGVEAYGTVTGGYFGDSNSSGYGRIGFGDDGVVGFGAGRPGYFQNTASPTSEVALAESGYGVIAFANSFPGYFDTPTHNATAIVADGTTSRGIEAYGTNAGGFFQDSDGTGYAYVGYGQRGIEAYGNNGAGAFHDTGSGAAAYLAPPTRGIEAFGLEDGGYFENDTNGAVARIAAYGTFGTLYSAAIVGQSNDGGADLIDNDSSGYGLVGRSTFKIGGNGMESFIQNHPTEKDRVIVYAAVEGDEVATYTRGTARLKNGVAHVSLGDTFAWVTNPDIGLTVYVTPRNECQGLFVESVTPSEIVVRELAGGRTDVTFDFIVYGLRIGFEETNVVQEKERESLIPSMKDHRTQYENHPELRRFNALERFKSMREAVGETAALDLSAAKALHDAVGEYDPAIHGPVDKLYGYAHSGPTESLQRERPRMSSTLGPVAPPIPAGSMLSATAPSVRASEAVELGDVLAADRSEPGTVRRGASAADPTVVGIAAANSAAPVGQAGSVRMALGGTIVPCKVDASYGAIHAGDLLTSSPTAGRAMRSTDGASGTILAKALESLDAGEGVIQVLVMIR